MTAITLLIALTAITFAVMLFILIAPSIEMINKFFSDERNDL